jgi:hypothetical protein
MVDRYGRAKQLKFMVARKERERERERERKGEGERGREE